MTDSLSLAPAALLERIALANAHTMRDAFDIGAALTAVAASGAMLSVYPAAGAPFLAHIASVDPAAPRFALVLPAAHALAPGRATFVAPVSGDARLQFELDCDWRDLATLPFPGSCLVLDRRAQPRADTALVDHFTARLSLPQREVELPLCDFATGGIGMHAQPHTAAALHVGQKLTKVRLQLGPALSIVADLEVRMLRPFRSYLLGEQVQVGCRYDRIEMELHSRG